MYSMRYMHRYDKDTTACTSKKQNYERGTPADFFDCFSLWLKKNTKNRTKPPCLGYVKRSPQIINNNIRRIRTYNAARTFSAKSQNGAYSENFLRILNQYFL